jgi:hypothetical protein
MSKWRAEVDIAFDREEDAVGFLNLLQEIKPKLFKGTGNEKIPIIATARYHECFHDETPPKQCGNYTNFDLKWEEKEIVRTKSGVMVTAESLITKEGV